MEIVRRVVAGAASGMMWIVSLSVLVSMFAGAIDVIGAYVFDQPLAGAVEGASNLMAVIVFGSLAYIQLRRGHIRVELFYARASPRARAILDILAAVVLIGFFALMCWQSWHEALGSWEIRESQPGLVRFPLYPAKFAIFLGSSVMLAQTVVDLIDSTRYALFLPGTPERVGDWAD